MNITNEAEHVMGHEIMREHIEEFRRVFNDAMHDEVSAYDLIRGILEEKESKYKNLIMNIHEYIYSVNYIDGIFSSTYHSDKSYNVTGYTPEEYEKNPYLWFSMIYENDRELVNSFLNKVITDRMTGTIEHRIIHKDGRIRWVSNTCTAVIDRHEELTHLNGFVLDITSRKMAERRMQFAITVLETLNKLAGKEDSIQTIIRLIRNYLGIDAVGIRLREGDDFPYHAFEGFPDYFAEAENSLCRCDLEGNRLCAEENIPLLDCMCGAIIQHRSIPDSKYFTKNSSFWTNSTTEFFASPSSSELNVHLRGRCNSEGYESVALIPLKSEGVVIGLLQLNDRRKGFFTLETIEFFEGVGASIGIAISRKIAEEALLASEEKLRQRNEAMERDLKMAQLVQNRFLHNHTPSSNRLIIEYRYLPHDAVGGDYFSITPMQEGGIGVFVGDVVGHGISAALFLSLLKAATDRVSRQYGTRPQEYLRLLNDELIEYMDFNFLTAVYGIFQFSNDNGTSEFIFANGGHPKPILHRRSADDIEMLDAGGTLLGAFPDMRYEEKSIELMQGDRIFLYTDGIPETKNEAGKIIGFDELQYLFMRAEKPKLGDTLDTIMGEVYKYKGNHPIEDDIVLIGLEIL